MSKIKLAVVDDQVILRKAIIHELHKAQIFDITLEASNGKLFMNAIDNTPVDLVILDIQMPEMDGFETLKCLKLIKPEIKVIMYSSHADEQMIQQLTKLGANSILSKNGDYSLLVRSINELCNCA